MTEKKQNSKVDWNDDDLAEWDDGQFDRAKFSIGDKVVREQQGTLSKKGRPKLNNPKQQITLRLDQAVVEKFKATGSGWQTRINQELRKTLGI